MRKALQIIIQIAFLALFIVLFVLGKIQLWMGVFILGILLSIFIGRLYCGWACPINTVMVTITWLKKKLRIKSFKIPAFIKKPWVRYSFLAIFIATFLFVIITGKQIPVLPIMFLLGILITLFFPPELWHRYLCPYGTILSFTSKRAKLAMRIDGEKCNNCTACKRVCPAEAVEKSENQHIIHKNECIVCSKCSDNCKKDAIKYK